MSGYSMELLKFVTQHTMEHQDGTIMTEHSMELEDDSVVVNRIGGTSTGVMEMLVHHLHQNVSRWNDTSWWWNRYG